MNNLPISDFERLLETVPADQIEFRTRMHLLIDNLRTCQSQYDTEMTRPPWIDLIRESIMMMSLSILTGAYIFRSARTGGNSILRDAMRYGKDAFVLLEQVIYNPERRKTTRWDNANFNTVKDVKDTIDRPVTIYNDNDYQRDG